MGLPCLAPLLDLLKDGHPVYGALRLPVLEQMVAGDGDRCVINGQDAKAKNFVSWEESLLLTTDERRIERSAYADSWNELKNKGGTFRTWGDCYGYYLLCSGKADAMFDIQLKPCDILPLLPIVTGAGCETIDFGDTPNQGSGGMRAWTGRQGSQSLFQRQVIGAGEGIRTLDIHLGKVVLYQLSYARKKGNTLSNSDKIQGNNANDDVGIP